MKEKYELAYDDYISGMKYKDIAAKYGVSVSAVSQVLEKPILER